MSSTFADLMTKVSIINPHHLLISMSGSMAKILYSLGDYLRDELQRRQLSNRALAIGAGVSDFAIRNMLKYGIDPRAKDPDPRTLRAVADYLGEHPLRLFILAGYVPPAPNAHSIRADIVAEIFDELDSPQQETFLKMMEVVADDMQLRHKVGGILNDISNPTAGRHFFEPDVLRYAANQLILLSKAVSANDLDKIDVINPDWELVKSWKWSQISEDNQRRIIALARSKLDMSYDPAMLDYKWRRFA